uniref:Uncharacterized protein n=1 Tax=Arundo donax TaxID=35708 RepID=A0A0A9DEH6_ARUDO
MVLPISPLAFAADVPASPASSAAKPADFSQVAAAAAAAEVQNGIPGRSSGYRPPWWWSEESITPWLKAWSWTSGICRSFCWLGNGARRGGAAHELRA